MSSEAEPIFLRDLIEVNPKVKMQKGQNYPFVDMASVKEWQRDVSVEDAELREFKGSGSKFEAGDILLARITPCFENGKTAIAPAIHGPGHGSTEFIVIRPKNPKDHAFVYGLLRSPEFRSHAIGQMVGTSGRQRIPNEAVLSFPLELPADSYRHKAAHLLGSIEDTCSTLRHQNTALEAIAQRLFRSWFVNFDPVHAKAAGKEPEAMSAELAALFPSDFEDSELGPIPKGWSVTTFGDAFDIKGGATPSTSEPLYWHGGTHAWATPKDMSSLASKVMYRTERQITAAGVAKISSKALPSGTVLMSSRAPVGYLAIAKAPISINQGFIAIPPTPGIPASFAVELLAYKMPDIKANAGGTTFAEISKTQFRPIKWTRPSDKVLAAFGKLVEPLYAQVHGNCLLVDSLASLRDHLLPRLISGKLSLEEAERVVEEAVAVEL
jgi:type I restriction enzyme S subunit